MKASIKSEVQFETFKVCKQITHRRNNLNSLKTVLDFKFYQKLFFLLISLSIFLIIPEAPEDLERSCQTYNSSQICTIW